jgi:D-psicose/D-tagatose/L-ribulose 3-epimerase
MNVRIFFILVAIFNLNIFSARADNTNLTIGYATADFATAKAASFDFAEVRIREFMKLSDDDFTKFAADCRTNGLPLTTAYWLLPNDLKVVGPDVKMDAVTNYFEKAFDRCQNLGVKIIVWGSGDARRAPDGFPKEKAFDQLVALGKFLAPEAQRRGIVIVAEPLRKAEANMINSVAEGLQWVEAVNHPNFQLLVDIYHMAEENENMAIIVKAGAHIAHVHVSNPKGRVLPLSADEYDYMPFFKALNQIGYHGTMTIETTKVNLATDGPKAIKFIRAAYAQAGQEVAKEISVK